MRNFARCTFLPTPQSARRVRLDKCARLRERERELETNKSPVVLAVCGGSSLFREFRECSVLFGL